MANGVLLHKEGSIYDDVPELRYQFPPIYRNALNQMVGDWVVYYEPGKDGGRKAYTAIAKIASIEPDPNSETLLYAQIEPGTYLQFDRVVPRLNPEGLMYESRLRGPDGPKVGGQVQAAVRLLDGSDFSTIVAAGFADTEVLPRRDNESASREAPGFSDTSQVAFAYERPLVRAFTQRPFRDRAFRRQVLEAYGSSCCLTGLKLINGGGRAEAEAAHIQPVAARGPDTVRNGLALSGTVHWMFDRGLVSIADDMTILISRKVNDRDGIEKLVNDDGKVREPELASQRPHPRYLKWHRENAFGGE